MSPRTTLLALVGTAIVSATASAAELSSVTMADDLVVIALTGDIAAGDTDAAEALIRTVNESGRLVSAIRLDSAGGSLAEAVKLADLVRRAKVPTVVATGSQCASACFIAFAAGVERFASYDAWIGVHGASDKFGHETPQTEAATVAMARIVSGFGVPPPIIGRMVATPAQAIAWLKPDELRDMGVIMTGRRRSPPAPAPDRQLAGLDAMSREMTVLPDRPARGRAQYAGAYAAAERGDYASAIRLWRQMADAGDGLSQYNLGRMYAIGLGVKRDPATAADWYRHAAESGVPDARLSLAIAYTLGRGVPQDLLEAHKWFDLAAIASTSSEDRDRALKLRDLVAARMTGDQIEDARRLVNEWQQRRRTAK